MRVLVVEDEKKVAEFIRKGLEEEGFRVQTAYDGETAVSLATTNEFAVIVLDLMLPGKNGFEVLTEARKVGVTTPVLLLTARGSLNDKVRGLNDGADDYLTKPFAFVELVARIRALARRGEQLLPSPYQIADLVVDPVSRSVARSGKAIELTTREFALLELLARNAGRVVTRTTIAEQVWDAHFDTGTNVIDVYINYLRKKIDTGHRKKLIYTVRGVGYVLKKS